MIEDVEDIEITVLKDRCSVLEDRLAKAHAMLAKAYAERSRVAILAAALAQHLGMRAGVYRDPDTSGDRFSLVLQIDLPTGQVRFRLDKADQEWTIFSPAWEMINDYDGHDEETLWRRIAEFKSSFCVRSQDDVVLASFRETAANLQAQVEMLRAQKSSLADRLQRERHGRQRLELAIDYLRELCSTTEMDCFLARLKDAKNLADEKMREMEEAETTR